MGMNARTWRLLMSTLTVAALVGCPASRDGSAAADDAPTSEDGPDEATDSGATTSATGASDPTGTDPSTTDTGLEPELPAACEGSIASNVARPFSLTFEGKWPDDIYVNVGEAIYELDAPCTVLAMAPTEEPLGWNTELACEYDGETRTAILWVETDESVTPGWSASDELRLWADVVDYDEFGGYLSIALLDADDQLWMHGLWGLDGQSFVPPALSVAYDYDYCDAPLPGKDIDRGKLRLSFTAGDPESSLALLEGESGQLSNATGQPLHVALGAANAGNCCHGWVLLSWLVMRI